MVWLLAQEDHATVRDHLLQLVAALSTHPVNCEKLINQDCIELIVDLLTTAHTTEVDQRVMPVLGSGGKGGGLMLLGDADQDFAAAEAERRGQESAAASGAGADAGASATAAGSAGGPGGPTQADQAAAAAALRRSKESAKVWHFQAAGKTGKEA